MFTVFIRYTAGKYQLLLLKTSNLTTFPGLAAINNTIYFTRSCYIGYYQLGKNM